MAQPLPRPEPRRHRRRGWRATGIVALSLVLVLLAAGAGGYAWLSRSLPQVAGQLAVPGLQAEVNVYRDAWSVPHIFAANRHDLFFAQGFITAQDRLFQMELGRRAVSGRLSEVVGAATLPTDRYYRTLTLRRVAEASLPLHSPEGQAVLADYAAGVNAFLRQGRLPPEFAILGIKPEPWTPVDSLAMQMYLSENQMGGFWQNAIWRFQLIQRVGLDKAAELFPHYPDAAPTIMRYLGGAQAELARVLAAAPLPDPGIGSNNWVVAGSRTASGKPLLANDPHVGVGNPAFFYQTHLNLASEGLNVIGVTAAGIPGVIVGHNDHVAWGVTNMSADTQDVFVEQPNPANPQEFLFQGRYEKAQVYQELIKVKGRSEPEPLTVLVTRHGPIISGITGSAQERPAAALALAWTGLQPAHPLDGLLSLGKARSWAEFREGLRLWQAPTMNFVFAADDGTIAYRGAALLPIRKQGNGLLPVPGWTGDYEWTGTVPFEAMPETVNPADGFIATANNKVTDDSYPYFISPAYSAPYRAMRLRETLLGARGWSVKQMQALQTDWQDDQAVTILPALLEALRQGLKQPDAREQAALQALQGWDKHMDPGSVGAAIYAEWYRQLQHEFFAGGMGSELFGRLPDDTLLTDGLVLAASQGKGSAWLPDDGLPGVAARSFQAALQALTGKLGGSVSNWRWDRLHSISFNHNLGAVKPLNLLFNRGPFPYGGSRNTVGNASYPRSSGYNITTAAPWRQVVDLGSVADNSFDVLAPGESGHPLSRHYADQASLWLQGQYHPQVFSAAALQTAGKLTLTPGAP